MYLFVVAIFIFSAITTASSSPEGHGYSHHIPHYHFEYGVHDPHTNDIKYHWEHREHDHVKGGYTLREPDGTQRIVEYTAGPHIGFQAVVKHVGHAQHPGEHNHGYGGASFIGTTHWGYGSGR